MINPNHNVVTAMRINPNPSSSLTIDRSRKNYLNFSQKNDHFVIQFGRELKGLERVAGMHALKEAVFEDVIDPLNNKEQYQKQNYKLPNAILLYGPSGCGKTYFAKALAEELGYKLEEVSGGKTGSGIIHETSNKLRKIFGVNADINNLKNKGTLIFIDEADSMMGKRLDNLDSSGGQAKNEETNELL